jgi:PAS domain S-box-containing protein
MKYHKLLLKQLAKYLPDTVSNNPDVNDFLLAVNESYIANDRDRELTERAFNISEEEYIELSRKLKHEAAVKKLSVEKLKEAVGTITGDEMQGESDDLLKIARYLNQQVGKRKNAEKVFTSLITNMQSGIMLENENRHIVFTNQLFCDLFNIPAAPESLQGIDCSNKAAQSKHMFKHPDAFIKRIQTILDERKLVTEERIELADGRVYQRDYIPIFVDNVYNGQLWSYTDITDRLKVQEAIEQSELKNRLIMSAALDAIITIDNLGIISFWNPQAEKIFGWPAAEMIGQKLSDSIIPPQHRKAHIDGMKHYMRYKEGPVLNKQIEITAIDRYGREFPIELSIVPVKQGDSEFFCSFIRDISERKANEAALERLSMVASANENGVVFTNSEGNIFWCNEGFSKISGYTAAEVMGRTPIELMKGPLTNRETLRRMVDDFSKTNSFNIELIQYRKDGSWFWGRSRGQAIRSKDGQVNYFAILEDITGEKEVQRKLREHEERLKLALNNVGDNYWEHNFITGKTFFSNPGNKLLGFNIDEYTDGATLWWQQVHPDDKKLLEENDLNYIKGLIDSHANEYRMIHKNGSIRWVLDRGVVIEKDQYGKPVSIIGTHIDITEQKTLEHELTQAKNAAEASTRAKEMFLANMSHEIRTPMNAIVGMANQLGKTVLNENQLFCLNTIHSAAENLLTIINDILDLTKIEAGKLSLERIGFEPKAAVDRILQVMMHRAQEKGLMFTNSFFDIRISPVLMGDPYRLNQVLLNLVSNAIKFTKKGSVDITCMLLEDNDASQKVQFVVTDTGIGMDETFLKNLFDKFSQEDDSITRKYGGTGLGMSICKDLVELMKGEITASSIKGEGTSIFIVADFDKGTQADIPRKEEVKMDAGLLKGKNILVTDDNDMNRLVAAAILKTYGAIITEAENGVDAIEKIKVHSFDLVLMDVQMPLMDGLEATAIIRKTISETLPIIALTASAIKGDSEKCIRAGMNDYLSKPFEEIKLLQLATRWLGGEVTDCIQEPDHSNADQLYNLSYLAGIAKNDVPFIKSIIEVFVTQTPALVKEMQDAFTGNDFDRIRKNAHRLKPSLHTLGIDSLKEDIQTLECFESATTSTVEVEQLLVKLDTTVQAVIEKLQQDELVLPV